MIEKKHFNHKNFWKGNISLRRSRAPPLIRLVCPVTRLPVLRITRCVLNHCRLVNPLQGKLDSSGAETQLANPSIPPESAEQLRHDTHVMPQRKSAGRRPRLPRSIV